jgi:hypothetical protein
MLLELDGEQVGATPLTVDVLPGVLRVVAAGDRLATMGGCTEQAE